MIYRPALPILLVLVLTIVATVPATSQPNSRALDRSGIGAPMLTWLGPDAELHIGAISGLDLSGLTAHQWNDFRTNEVRRLRSADDDERTEALQNIIYAALYYPESAHLNRSTMSLFNVYRFDDSERNRIMALVALRAIGKDASMRILAAHIRWEKSARVRQLTEAAVQDYYTTKTK